MAGWYPAGRDHAGSEHLDPEYVATYDAKTQLDVEDALASLRRLGLDADSTLVDLGCGTGLLASAAAVEARRVVGVDVCPARDEYSTFAWLLESLLEHAGFEILGRDVPGGIYATYVCAAR